MILKSFEAFMKAVHSKFGLEKLVGVVTKEKIDQIISDIRKSESVNEEFYISDSKEAEDWYGLKMEWNQEERFGILIAKDKDGTDWYKFNLGSLHLTRLYDLVPDLDKLEEEELKAVAEEEILDNLMKWNR